MFDELVECGCEWLVYFYYGVCCVVDFCELQWIVGYVEWFFGFCFVLVFSEVDVDWDGWCGYLYEYFDVVCLCDEVFDFYLCGFLLMVEVVCQWLCEYFLEYLWLYLEKFIESGD